MRYIRGSGLETNVEATYLSLPGARGRPFSSPSTRLTRRARYTYCRSRYCTCVRRVCARACWLTRVRPPTLVLDRARARAAHIEACAYSPPPSHAASLSGSCLTVANSTIVIWLTIVVIITKGEEESRGSEPEHRIFQIIESVHFFFSSQTCRQQISAR